LQLAAKCKKIYQAEFARLDIDGKNKDKHQNDPPVTEHRRKTKSDDDRYDSDETIEMTEEEIDFACRQLPGLCG
jgi:DNA-repair protein XRCC1